MSAEGVKRRQKASRFRVIRQGWRAVIKTGTQQYHLLAPTLCRSGVAVACADQVVDLDSGWQAFDFEELDDRQLCQGCARFGAFPLPKKTRAA
jgi:hypothetical protein